MSASTTPAQEDDARKLTRAQAAGLLRLKEGFAWDDGRAKSNGSVREMFSRMKEAGLVEGEPPYTLTAHGEQVLAAYQKKRASAETP